MGPTDKVHGATRLAARQSGLITTAQMRSVGFSGSAVGRLHERGWIHRVHRGVYSVGRSKLTEDERLAAALLACGGGAVISHLSAAAVWGLIPARDGPVHVSVAGHARRRPGIVTHRPRTLEPVDRVRRGALRLTAPTRTIVDLATVTGRAEVEAALNEALLHRMTDRERMSAVLTRLEGHPGVGLVRSLVVAEDSTGFSRSEAETTLWKLIVDAGLPRPERNVRVHGYELDLYWREHRIDLEMDGYRWHSTRARLNRDRERDADLSARGVRVIRLSYDQLSRPTSLIARIAAALALAAEAQPAKSER